MYFYRLDGMQNLAIAEFIRIGSQMARKVAKCSITTRFIVPDCAVKSMKDSRPIMAHTHSNTSNCCHSSLAIFQRRDFKYSKSLVWF